MNRGKLKKALFVGVFPLVWILVFAALELGLTATGYGRDYALFEHVEPGMVIDNADYLRRFYASAEAAEPAQRSNLFLEEKPPGSRRVFVVGGSTAQGFPFQRNHSFTAMAEASLRSLGMAIEIVNLGNSAMSSYYVREVLGELREYEPDLVVVYAGHNEYYGTVTAFTGGTHAMRLAVLRLKRLRSVQLLEDLTRAAVGGRRSGDSATLMEQRFADAAFPADGERDAAVADLFVRNLRAGLRPLLDRGVPAVVFEPVGNLVSMPPFRAETPPASSAGEDATTSPAAPSDPIEMYRREKLSLEGGLWDRSRWERIRDLDAAPFRARSVLVGRLRGYVEGERRIRWIPTADALEVRAGPAAFSDDYFIDHLHFNFEGQVLLGQLLAQAILEQLGPPDPEARFRLALYFEDPDRIRTDIHLTSFWEFEAYSRIFNLLAREPFASMPIAKAPPALPERIIANSLFQTRDFVESLQGATAHDLFYLALDHYRARGERDEWIANMNAYVHVFPGHFESHLAYGMALLDDDPRAHLEPAGGYFRRAYYLSRRSPEVTDLVRSEMYARGLAPAWESFRLRYLH